MWPDSPQPGLTGGDAEGSVLPPACPWRGNVTPETVQRTPRPVLGCPRLAGRLCPPASLVKHTCAHVHTMYFPAGLGPPLGSKHLGTTLSSNSSPLWSGRLGMGAQDSALCSRGH